MDVTAVTDCFDRIFKSVNLEHNCIMLPAKIFLCMWTIELIASIIGTLHLTKEW